MKAGVYFNISVSGSRSLAAKLPIPFRSISSVRHSLECTFTFKLPSLDFCSDLNAGSEATCPASAGVVTIPIPLPSAKLLFTKIHSPVGISGKGGVQVGGCVHGQGR